MLLTEDMNLVVVRGGEYGQPNSAMSSFARQSSASSVVRDVLKEMDHQPPGEEPESRRSSFMSRRPSYNAPVAASSAKCLLLVRITVSALVVSLWSSTVLPLDTLSARSSAKILLLRISNPVQGRYLLSCFSPLQKALLVKLIKDDSESLISRYRRRCQRCIHDPGRPCRCRNRR